MDNLWDACLRRLEQELPAQQFNTWIRPLSPESSEVTNGDSEILVLSAPNRFVLDLVRERFVSRIERLAAEASGRECGVRLVLARSTEVPPKASNAPARYTEGPSAAPAAPERGRLNRGFTFDSFVTGKAN